MRGWISVVGCGGTGGLVMFAITEAEFGKTEGVLVCAALGGAALAGRVAAQFFGEEGGWALAGLGAVLATTLGAALAGFLLLAGLDPVGALILPPAFVWKALIDTPVTAAIWFSGISLTHLAARRHSLK